MTIVAQVVIDPHANPEFLTFDNNVAAIFTASLGSKGIGLKAIKVTKDQDPKKTPDRAQGVDSGRRNITPPEDKQKLSKGDVNSDSEKSTSDDENKKPSEVDDATKDAAEKKSPTSAEKPAADAEGSLLIADGSDAKKSDKNEKPAAEAVNTLAIADGSDPKTSAGEETTDPKASKDPSVETAVPSANENENQSADPRASKEDNLMGDNLKVVHGLDKSGEVPKAPKDTPAHESLVPKDPEDTPAPEAPTAGTTDKAGEVPKAPEDTPAPESPTAGTTTKAASDSGDNLSPPQLERASGNQIYVETVKVLHLVNDDTPGAVPLNSKEGRRMICDGPKNVLLLKDKPEKQSTTPAEEDVRMDIDVDSE